MSTFIKTKRVGFFFALQGLMCWQREGRKERGGTGVLFKKRF